MGVVGEGVGERGENGAVAERRRTRLLPAQRGGMIVKQSPLQMIRGADTAPTAATEAASHGQRYEEAQMRLAGDDRSWRTWRECRRRKRIAHVLKPVAVGSCALRFVTLLCARGGDVVVDARRRRFVPEATACVRVALCRIGYGVAVHIAWAGGHVAGSPSAVLADKLIAVRGAAKLLGARSSRVIGEQFALDRLVLKKAVVADFLASILWQAFRCVHEAAVHGQGRVGAPLPLPCALGTLRLAAILLVILLTSKHLALFHAATDGAVVDSVAGRGACAFLPVLLARDCEVGGPAYLRACIPGTCVGGARSLVSIVATRLGCEWPHWTYMWGGWGGEGVAAVVGGTE